MRKIALAMAICWIAFPTLAAAQQAPDGEKKKPEDSMATCPMHDSHAKMNERGEEGMGFSQTAATHHFFLTAEGGVIQVETNDSADKTDREAIRMHLAHIAEAFANGNFEIPMFVHDTVPPGVPEMKRQREKIRYSFEETPVGGRVVIQTSDPESLVAIHKFLRFQIEEHKTGDSTEIR
jgi:hypothetical protein